VISTPQSRAYEQMIENANHAIRMYHTLPEEVRVLISETEYVNRYLDAHPVVYTCVAYQN